MAFYYLLCYEIYHGGCWKEHFRASRFQFFLGEHGLPPYPHRSSCFTALMQCSNRLTSASTISKCLATPLMVPLSANFHRKLADKLLGTHKGPANIHCESASFFLRIRAKFYQDPIFTLLREYFPFISPNRLKSPQLSQHARVP